MNDISQTETDNHLTAVKPDLIDDVENQIKAELEDNNYRIVKDKPRIISALSGLRKKDGSIQIIQDCSLPDSGSLNSHASKDPCAYQTVNDALSMIHPGWYMAKQDLKSAYRSVGIKEEEQCLTGIKWKF